MNGINPAWKPMLDKIPVELQQLVIPIFQEWDKGVQTKFQEIRDEYKELESFKKFAEANIDPDYIEKAVVLADQLQREPAKIVSQINEAWDLGFVSKEDAEKLGQQASPPGEPNEDFEFTGDDISKHPRIVELEKQIAQFQQSFDSEKQARENAQQLQEFEEYLDGLEQSYTDPNREGGPLPFNRMIVTALISQGLDGEAAVKQYHQELALTSVTADSPSNDDASGSEPPPVMGGGGSTGSGSPDGSVDFGAMSNQELNKSVQALLEAQLNANQ